MAERLDLAQLAYDAGYAAEALTRLVENPAYVGTVGSGDRAIISAALITIRGTVPVDIRQARDDLKVRPPEREQPLVGGRGWGDEFPRSL